MRLTIRYSLLVLAAAVATVGCVTSTRPGDAPTVEPVEATFTVVKNVVYTPSQWPAALICDLYVVDGEKLHPALVVVHGGGWNGRDRSDMDRLSRQLAKRGYTVANIDYRLAPQFRHPAQVNDVRAAYAYLQAHAARLKVDPERIGAWGYSAGAHLVALAAMDPQPASARFKAVVAGGTPADFERYPGSPVITTLMGASLADAPEAWKQASPINHVSKDDPPTFLYHGTLDKIVQPEDARALYERLVGAGIPAELAQVRGLGHIATFLLGFSVREQGIAFLDRYLLRQRDQVQIRN